jgi:hypothetical protein
VKPGQEIIGCLYIGKLTPHRFTDDEGHTHFVVREAVGRQFADVKAADDLLPRLQRQDHERPDPKLSHRRFVEVRVLENVRGDIRLAGAEDSAGQALALSKAPVGKDLRRTDAVVSPEDERVALHQSDGGAIGSQGLAGPADSLRQHFVKT